MNRAGLPLPPVFADLQNSGQPALYLDFDGTLVEIAHSPDAITVDAQLGSRLERLSDELECALAIVSGRSIENLVHYLGSAKLLLAWWACPQRGW